MFATLVEDEEEDEGALCGWGCQPAEAVVCTVVPPHKNEIRGLYIPRQFFCGYPKIMEEHFRVWWGRAKWNDKSC